MGTTYVTVGTIAVGAAHKAGLIWNISKYIKPKAKPMRNPSNRPKGLYLWFYFNNNFIKWLHVVLTIFFFQFLYVYDSP